MPHSEPQHLRASAQALKLLDDYGITEPHEIRVENIAWDLGVEITVRPLRNAEALLIRVGDVGAITLSDSLADRAHRSFAVGHELGHWQMHRGISQMFFCTEEDMKEYRHSGPELEANTFASELLMPKFMIDPKLLNGEPSWQSIQDLSGHFSVAPITAAIRYADLARQPVMAVFSDGVNVKWWRENKARMDGLWLESKQPISEESLVFHDAQNSSPDVELRQVPWEAWFPHINARDDEELWEFSARLDEMGTMLSMLWVPSRA